MGDLTITTSWILHSPVAAAGIKSPNGKSEDTREKFLHLSLQKAWSPPQPLQCGIMWDLATPVQWLEGGVYGVTYKGGTTVQRLKGPQCGSKN